MPVLLPSDRAVFTPCPVRHILCGNPVHVCGTAADQKLSAPEIPEYQIRQDHHGNCNRTAGRDPDQAAVLQGTDHLQNPGSGGYGPRHEGADDSGSPGQLFHGRVIRIHNRPYH